MGDRRAGLRRVRAVAGAEFGARLRTRSWWIDIGAWFLFVSGFAAVVGTIAARTSTRPEPGVPTFGWLVLVVLLVLLLVVPGLAAGSVRGWPYGAAPEVEAAPAELALGRLVAVWATIPVFLAAVVPAMVATVAMGGVGPLRPVAALLALAVVLGAVAALAQCLAVVFVRGTLLAYVAVLALGLGTLGAFDLGRRVVATPAVEASISGDLVESRVSPTEREKRADRVWWLLAPNPFVLVADAAPHVQARYAPRDEVLEEDRLPEPFDPLAEVGRLARAARDPRLGAYYHDPGYVSTDRAAPDPAPVWPYGLAFDLALGAGAVFVTVRRSRRSAVSPFLVPSA